MGIEVWAPENWDLGARWFGRKEGLISQSRAPVFCRLSKKPNNRRDQATRLSGIAGCSSNTSERERDAHELKTEFAISRIFACCRCSGHWCQSDEHIPRWNGSISCKEFGISASYRRPFEAGRWSVMGAMSRHHSCEPGGKLFSAGAMISLIALFEPGGIWDYDGQFLSKMIVWVVTLVWSMSLIITVVPLTVFWPAPKSAAKPISHPASWLGTLFAHKRPKFSTIERFISQSFCGLTNNGENQGGGLMLIPAHNRPLPKAYGSQTSSDEQRFQREGLPSSLQRSKSLSPGWWPPRFVKWDSARNDGILLFSVSLFASRPLLQRQTPPKAPAPSTFYLA